MSEEKKIELLMKVIDDVATESELLEFEQLAAADAKLNDEYIAMKRMKEVTDSMRFKEMPDSFWEGYWNGIYNNLERGIGWTLVTIAAALLSSFGLFHVFKDFFLDGNISILVRLGVGIGSLGVLVLLWSILREVLFARKRERYKEIER
ncbi:MAG: hypothetical protein KAT58_05545 [candidate division Zixibacteria bacterium]|nr:hypothetical protein [candidate division Zixibacteria bacterium]